MATLREIHRYMNERRTVVLADGRAGKISRVDTFFPSNETIVTVWLKDGADVALGASRGGAPSNVASGLVKVGLGEIAGPTEAAPKAPRSV
jgi:hypothetical protein